MMILNSLMVGVVFRAAPDFRFYVKCWGSAAKYDKNVESPE